MSTLDIPDDLVPILAAMIAAAGVAATLLMTWLGGLNRRLRRLEHRDRLSWLYIRSLIDHAYRHAPGVPLPEPPDGWQDDID